MNKLSLAVLNETWLYKSDTQARHLLQDLKNETGIQILRKDRDSRGGGVAIAFNTNIMSLKKLNLSSLKNMGHLEILAARGRLRNYKKEINVFSCYILPKLTRQQSVEFLDALSDTIAECKMSSEGWFIIGGDWNHRSLVDLIDIYPDLKQIITPPTRKNSVLDILVSNIGPYIRNKQVCSPIEGEYGRSQIIR